MQCKFYCALLLSILTTSLLSADPQAEEKVEACKLFPSSVEEIQNYTQLAKGNFDRSIDAVTNIRDRNRTFENTMRLWNEAGRQLLANIGVLLKINEIAVDPLTKAAGQLAAQSLQNHLFDCFSQNSSLYNAFLNYIRKTKEGKEYLTPVEWYILYSFLQTTKLPEHLATKERQLNRLKVWTSTKEKVPFRYLKGEFPEKVLLKGQHAFTVLNLNICFLPGELTYFFGGVTPWHVRVNQIAQKVISTNADVVCLQEVFVEEAGLALFEKLKKNYAHFYVSIGPRHFGLSLQSMGLPSGLFVASKFPVENPFFTPFAICDSKINFGIFDFIIKNQSEPLGHLYNMHLQAYSEEAREQQIEQILTILQRDFPKNPNIPFFLCGDLNITWGSQEPGEKLIKAHFHDAYNFKRKEVTMKDGTWSNFLTNYYMKALKKTKDIPYQAEIIDYALLLHNLPSIEVKPLCSHFKIETKLLPMNSIDYPERALSDHHGLLTTVTKINQSTNR